MISNMWRVHKFLEDECGVLKSLHPSLIDIEVEIKIKPATGFRNIDKTKSIALELSYEKENLIQCPACRKIVDKLVYCIGEIPECESCSSYM
jgi:hypothetical protein